MASDTRPTVTATTEADTEVGKALMAMFQGEGALIPALALRGIEEALEKDIEGMEKGAKDAEKDVRKLGVERLLVRLIQCMVPTGPKTIDTLKITSDASWTSVQHQIADKMDTAMKRLSLSYKISTETKDALARMLNMLVHWLEIKDGATEVYKEHLRQQGCKG
ncbi:hypothetical protein JB92DRAFT_3248100 [Gautieria morchelliformis]|nr:hypothetical protein JB92DRAFT_3248100 [Gautieria morchelliformis]